MKQITITKIGPSTNVEVNDEGNISSRLFNSEVNLYHRAGFIRVEELNSDVSVDFGFEFEFVVDKFGTTNVNDYFIELLNRGYFDNELGGVSQVVNLDDLDDVDTTGADNGNILVWNDTTNTWEVSDQDSSEYIRIDLTGDFSFFNFAVVDDLLEGKTLVLLSDSLGPGTRTHTYGSFSNQQTATTTDGEDLLFSFNAVGWNCLTCESNTNAEWLAQNFTGNQTLILNGESHYRNTSTTNVTWDVTVGENGLLTIQNQNAGTLTLNYPGSIQDNITNGLNSIVLESNEIVLFTRQTGGFLTVVSRYPGGEDTSGTVETWVAGVAITSTNGEPINPGDEYIRFPDGTTWAHDVCVSYTESQMLSTFTLSPTGVSLGGGNLIFGPAGSNGGTAERLFSVQNVGKKHILSFDHFFNGNVGQETLFSCEIIENGDIIASGNFNANSMTAVSEIVDFYPTDNVIIRFIDENSTGGAPSADTRLTSISVEATCTPFVGREITEEIDWIKEECFEEPGITTQEQFTGTDYTDDNVATTPSGASSNISLVGPLTLTSGLGVSSFNLLNDTLRVTTNATNVDGTVVLTFDSAVDVTIGVERLNGNEIVNFITPIDSMVLGDGVNVPATGPQAFSGSGNNRNEFSFVNVTEIEFTQSGPNTGFVLYDIFATINSDPIERIVRTLEDGTLQLVDRVANTLTDLALIPVDWTPCVEEPTLIVSANSNNDITVEADGGAFLNQNWNSVVIGASTSIANNGETNTHYRLNTNADPTISIDHDSYELGATLRFINIAFGTGTVNFTTATPRFADGTDQSITSIELERGEFIEVMRVGGNWRIVNKSFTTDVNNAVTITNSVVNGINIREHSDGYVEMWGTDTTGGLNSRVITFPNGITMSDTSYKAHCNVDNATANRFVQIGSRGTTTLTLRPHNTASDIIWSVEGYRQ